MNTAGLIDIAGRIPFIGTWLRFLGHRYREGSVVKLRSGVAAGFRWMRHHRYVNGYWIGHYEVATQEALRRELAQGDMFFDIGANAGVFTLVAAKLVGSKGRCVAFDPLPENIASVCEQIELNSLDNCTAIQEALGACEGYAEFSVRADGDPTAHFARGKAEHNTVLVKVTTLDRAMERYGRPVVIKMDIEGAEVEALQGAERLLSEARPKWLIELHGPECGNGVREILSKHGYQFFDLCGRAEPAVSRLPHHVVAKAMDS